MAFLKKRCPGCKRASCDGCGIYEKKAAETGSSSEQIDLKKLNTNKRDMVWFPKGFAPEPGEGLGISFDVGTTTLAGMLWNLETGLLLEAETAANPQAIFGADVVSRIRKAEDEDKLERMRALLVEKLDAMALAMAERAEESKAVIYKESSKKEERGFIRRVTLVGNTAMCEILLGIRPEGLLRAPFTPDYRETVRIKGRKAGFRFLRDAEIIALPPIEGFVGADALAVYGYIVQQEKGKCVLAVDIGTNGEILLQCGEKKYACSAAAGPALEGGAVSQGMRAAKGAIDRVSLSGRFPMEDIVCHTVMGGPPAGICGSGLVDALAALLQAGVLEESGYMRKSREAKAAGAPERLCRRIKTGPHGQKFLLTDENYPIYLTGDGVRQLQLAIGAIRSGIEVLLKKAGQRVEELDKIYLAGAFGCYIGTKSAMAVGLLPEISEEKLLQAGNLAGVGAAMALLSPKALERMEAERKGFVHVELAEEEDFEKIFLANLNFRGKE
ncbi:MAG: ASKHA domain-containing protein [Clostridium sp.]|nr:ASKHA domain-containing protein [Clostridium sp.]